MKKSSGSSVFYLNHFERPNKTIRSTTESICFFFDTNGEIHSTHKTIGEECLFRLATLDFDPSREEKALILSVKMLYSHNDYDGVWTWEVEKLFDQKKEEEEETKETQKQQQHHHHPDSTGKLRLVIPGCEFKGVLKPSDSLVYEPKLVHLGTPVLLYAGLENHILGARSTCVTPAGICYDYQAFCNNDPFIVFLLENKDKFDEINAQDIKQGENKTILVKRPLVKRVQQFFQNALFPLFRYVSQNTVITFEWPKEQWPKTSGFINVIIQVDYLVITPQIPKYKTHEIILNL
jgi:hypothetical protein